MGGGYFLVALALAAMPGHGSGQRVYSTICDGSAVALVAPGRFVTISDEDPIIRSFLITGGSATWSLDLRPSLGLQAGGEGDVEAAARIGDTIYWVASLGTDGDGNIDPSRRQFFATKIAADGKQTVIGTTPGQNGRRLFDALVTDPKLAGYQLAEKAKIAPKLPDGLNIEGLAAKPTGALMIAFRNPLVGPAKQKALIVTLSNPAEVAVGGIPVFSEVAEIDLGKRGVRDIVYRPAKGDYLVLAGAIDETSNFALFRWSGKSTDDPHRLASDFGTLNPEAVAVLDDGRLFILSDDGDVVATPGTKKCKKVPDAQKQFRAVILPAPD